MKRNLTAIPIIGREFSLHFSLADTFVVFNTKGKIAEHFPSPISKIDFNDCKMLIDSFCKHGVSRVVARKIHPELLNALIENEFQIIDIPSDVNIKNGTLWQNEKFMKLLKI